MKAWAFFRSKSRSSQVLWHLWIIRQTKHYNCLLVRCPYVREILQRFIQACPITVFPKNGAFISFKNIYIQMQWELYVLWKTKLGSKIRSKSVRHQSEDTVDKHSQRLDSKQTRCFEIIASRKRTSSHKSARILWYCIWMSLCYTLPS